MIAEANLYPGCMGHNRIVKAKQVYRISFVCIRHTSGCERTKRRIFFQRSKCIVQLVPDNASFACQLEIQKQVKVYRVAVSQEIKHRCLSKEQSGKCDR